MPNRLLHAIAERLRPELATMSGLELIGSLMDLIALAYTAPFAVAGLIWLAISTKPVSVVQDGWALLLVLVIAWIFRRLDFSLRLEVRPGVFALASGSFETLAYWSAALFFGPTALWVSVIVPLLNYEWLRRKRRNPRWYRVRELSNSIASTTLGGLTALDVYEWLGGSLPFPGLTPPSLSAVLIATLVWFLLPRVLLLPVLLYASRSPELVGSESLADQASMTRFLLMGTLIFGIADPFALLAANAYATQGLAAYLAFSIGALLAALLANRLSRTMTHSEQQARVLSRLEELSRAIVTSPASMDALPDILSEYVPGMFPQSRIGIHLLPDLELYDDLPEDVTPSDEVWGLLGGESAPYHLNSDALPSGPSGLVWKGLLVPILKAETTLTIGDIYLLVAENAGPIEQYLTPVQTLAAQISSALKRIELHKRALEEQAEAYQKEVYVQAYQAEMYAQALSLEKLTKELQAAGQIQASFLPEEPPDMPGWQLAVALEAAHEASGDFYDYFTLSNGHLGLVIADVADKGMGAALYMALSRTLIRTYALEHHDAPEKALAAANARILADTNSELFVTVFYGDLDPVTGLMTYCNAGHNPPLHLNSRNRNNTKPLKRTALPLGILDDTEWGRSSLQLMPGDTLMLYTDGITEAQNEEEAFFGERRLRDVLEANAGRSADVIEGKVIDAVYDFVGDAPQYDDITLMVLVRDS